MIYILVTYRYTHTPGPSVVIDCPGCKRTSVVAKTSTVDEQPRVAALIPLPSSRQVTVQCTACQRSFRTSRDPYDLTGMGPQEISADLDHWIATNIAFLVKFCILVGLLLCLFPIMGLIFAAIGFAGTWRKRSRWRTAAKVAFWTSLVATIGIVSLMLTQPTH